MMDSFIARCNLKMKTLAETFNNYVAIVGNVKRFVLATIGM